MTLVWKLLRQHMSIPQLLGFFFSNLVGMLIVLLGFQFFNDVKPAFSERDGLLKPDYIILNKKINTIGGLTGSSVAFSEREIEKLADQPFCKSIGRFQASQYHVYAVIGISGGQGVTTDMFFESVPDEFLDVTPEAWHYSEGDECVPIIIPRSYLTLYNLGFAESQSLPKVSENIAKNIEIGLLLRGNDGREMRLTGRVAGFTNRINSILVPEKFMAWSNAQLASEESSEATRLVMQVNNPADERIMKFVKGKHYDIADDKLDAGKTTFFLKVVGFIVMLIGLLITAMSFYNLMLSIYLLVQKNQERIQTLLFIGYSVGTVATPYRLLTTCLNVTILFIAFGLMTLLRGIYLDMMNEVFSNMQPSSVIPTLILGIVLFAMVSVFNAVAITRKIAMAART